VSNFDTTSVSAALISKRSNTSIPKYNVWCSDHGALSSQILCN